MSRFQHIYTLLASIIIDHESDLLAEKHLAIYPDKETAIFIEKHKLHLKPIPDGLLILYKKSEEFVAETVMETILINGEEVEDERIIGYASTAPTKTYSDWLPTTLNHTLNFYGICDQQFRNNTKLNALALNEFITYKVADLRGSKGINNTIKERTKPDAIFQVDLTDANRTAPTKLKFKIK